MRLVFLALLPPNLCIFDSPLSRLASEQHQRKPSILLCVCFRKPMLYFPTTTAPQIHMCACVWLLRVAYPIPRAPCYLMGVGAPMRSRGLRSPRVFLYVGAQVASTLNPNARPSSPQPRQQDIKNQQQRLLKKKNGRVCAHLRMCAVG